MSGFDRTSTEVAQMFPDSQALYVWLVNFPGVKSQFEMVVMSLRRKEISGALPCAKATVEVLRTALGNCRYTNTYHMISCVRAIGKELCAAVLPTLLLHTLPYPQYIILV